ncbi:MAG: DEAD/DEAH box helicase [Aliishimia sp.]
MTDFFSLGLAPRLVDRLTELGLTDPTPIQTRAIPLALEGRDVMGLAQTGTGKTAAFGLPMVQLLTESGKGKPAPKTLRGLVLAPTRELAKQIMENLEAYIKGTQLSTTLVVGGKSLHMQAKRMARGCDILVATPGRLLDLLARGDILLDKCEFLVLDEADQMLDLGFIHDLRKIAQMVPAGRQTLLFSATMPKLMNEVAAGFLNNPERVQVSPPGKAADKITQSVHFIAKAGKTDLLIELLDAHREELALVFSRTKHGAEKLRKTLEKAGFASESIHGNKSQNQRDRALVAFRSRKARVLVATDVAARGIDIPDVRFVYNYDLPNVPENYVHRIGRTARAGAEGQAVAFCAPDEAPYLRDIQKIMKMDIPVASGTAWAGVAAPSGRPQGPSRKGGGYGKSGAGKPGGGNNRRRNRGGRSGGAKSGPRAAA